MNPAKFIRIVLLLVLALSIFSAVRASRVTFSASPAVLAQQETEKQNPPRKRQKTSPENQEDQEILKGSDSISVSVDLVSLQVSGNRYTRAMFSPA